MPLHFDEYENKCIPLKFKRFLHIPPENTSNASSILHVLVHFGKYWYHANDTDSGIIQHLVLIPPLLLPGSVT